MNRKKIKKAILDKDWVSDCCSSTMSEVKNGGISPFKCNYCGKRCQPKQLKNQGLEINKLGKTMNASICKENGEPLDRVKDIIKEFREKFPSQLVDICPIDGTPVPIHNGWWVFLQGHDKKCLPQGIEQFILKAVEEAREDGITAGMDLVKATYEANKEAWEKKAREEVKEELREKAEEMKTDGSNQLFSNRNLNYSDGYNQAIENILKLIN